MATCDMCGKEAPLCKSRLEGTTLDVCPQCTRFGKAVQIPRAPKIRQTQAYLPARKEILQIITEDYPRKIKHAREKLGMNQEEFAKRLNEKCSIMQKIEAGQFKPSIDMARKLENILKIRIIEEYAEQGEVPINISDNEEEGAYTIADFIKKKS